MGYPSQSLTFDEFQRANDTRQSEYPNPHDGMELVACIAEELGEIAQCVLGIQGAKERKKHLTRDDLGAEIADAITYLDLLATRYGLNTGEILANKFNKVSERIGSKVKESD